MADKDRIPSIPNVGVRAGMDASTPEDALREWANRMEFPTTKGEILAAVHSGEAPREGVAPLVMSLPDRRYEDAEDLDRAIRDVTGGGGPP